MATLAIGQKSTFLAPNCRTREISFEVEVLSDATYDIAIKLPLSESVVLTQDADGRITATHKAEPTMPDLTPDASVFSEILINGLPVAWPPQDMEELAADYMKAPTNG